jgi:hypothetical protein
LDAPYKAPLHPIHLADGSVLYSEGIGSVRFIPEVNGRKMAPLEFTNVLYVPSLSTNLFSVLYLTMHRHFNVSIELDKLYFIRGGNIVFQAKVLMSYAAYLVGDTIPVEDFASLSSTATLPYGPNPLASSPLPPSSSRHQKALVRQPGDWSQA